ncbi:putative metal-nicotianamine transporter YSL7 [Abeliophyllum distichum]|uniref:Metal-nicotianamine transporter YSL7 n=1 Tax=Abeliophyllum distichum TaxID=126358 RepID=A0ABD1V794_9LAMI
MDSSGSSENVESRVHELNIKEEVMIIGEIKKEEELSVEQIFAKKRVMKLNLTVGIIPSLNVSAGLLGFFFVKTWTKLLERSGLLKQPFTRQENTVIQTCVVAASGIAFSGGFGSYLFAMSERVVKQSEKGQDGFEYKNPELRMDNWLSFCSQFSRSILFGSSPKVVPATAHLINSFHTPEGAKLAKKQVRELGKFFTFSFLWSFFQWFFTATDACGFQKFPTLGLKAFDYKFYFDFSATYVGVGMICPHIVNVSVLIGGIISWGIMWPLIETRKGHWYSADLDPDSMQGLKGYKVFIAIALILGDGLYNFTKVLSQTIAGLYNKIQDRKAMHLPVAECSSPIAKTLSYDDQRRTQLFVKDQIPTWLAIGGYVAISAVSTATLPHIFHQLKWYHIIVIYIFAPVLAFCNAFGCGLTDWSLASAYGKLAIFTIGAWAGASHGGVLAGLAACGVMMNIVSTASDLMQDFKTG